MAPSEGLDGVALGGTDVPGGLALSIAAGWNQIADDWAFFISQGHASGFRAPADGLVATTAAVVYGGGIAWISMVLVAQAWRHRGLASLLLERTLGRLEALQAKPMLDATPFGEPVYRHLGFRTGFGFERWQGDASAVERLPTSPVAALRPFVPADLDRVVALDQAATRLGRRGLLQNILQRAGTSGWVTADGEGFAVARAGHRATQIGPLVASSPAQALSLLAAILRDVRGDVFIDVPTRCTEVTAWLEALGFARQRPYVRMAMGIAPIECDDRQFALAGPEFG
jgi:GNAT superfamily N-acetyltransferase